MMPAALELLFRGLVHGLLAQSARINRPKGRILLSWPLLGASLLFAGYTLWQTASGVSLSLLLERPLSHLQPVLGAFLLGLVLGMVRERSQSIIPPMIFHIVAAAAVMVAAHIAF
jgi:membrane protease YdiL (CAAX protease family)